MPTRRTRRRRTWKLRIERRRFRGTWRWTVDNPKGWVYRGRDTIEWTLVLDRHTRGKRISAHFQFAHEDLVEAFKKPSDLTRDLTAVIKAPGGKLELKVRKDACPRENPRYYAVWIQDETLRHGGVYAIGKNPPPEMQVGP